MNVKRLERATSNAPATSAKKVSTKDDPPTSPVWRPSAKIRDRHGERLAIVYVRQSSAHQVLENRESRERQYALATLAQQFGWGPCRGRVHEPDPHLRILRGQSVRLSDRAAASCRGTSREPSRTGCPGTTAQTLEGWDMSKRRPKKVVQTTEVAPRLRKALAKRTKDELLDMLVELAERIAISSAGSLRESSWRLRPKNLRRRRAKRSRMRPISTSETSTATSTTTTKPTAK